MRRRGAQGKHSCLGVALLECSSVFERSNVIAQRLATK